MKRLAKPVKRLAGYRRLFVHGQSTGKGEWRGSAFYERLGGRSKTKTEYDEQNRSQHQTRAEQIWRPVSLLVSRFHRSNGKERTVQAGWHWRFPQCGGQIAETTIWPQKKNITRRRENATGLSWRPEPEDLEPESIEKRACSFKTYC